MLKLNKDLILSGRGDETTKQISRAIAHITAYVFTKK